MPRHAITWATTDSHLFHRKLSDAGLRPPDSDERWLRGLQRLVAPQDTLIHFGDVIFYRYPSLRALLAPIPGRKVLVLGNHDRKPWRWYMRNGFDFACDGLLLGDVYCSHAPVEALPSGAAWNVHGHLHGNPNPSPRPWHVPLALETHGYDPVALEQVIGRHLAATAHPTTRTP